MIRYFPRFAVLILPLMASCGAEPVRPTTSAPVPPPQPAQPAPVVPVASTDWRDQSLTPGTWRYAAGAPLSAARFGTGQAAEFALQCDAGSRRITVSRSGTATEMTITTSSRTARLPAGSMEIDGRAMTAVILNANDTLLDAMAFSRGRVMIASPGLPPVIVPAWAEITRAIEDCRK